MWPTGTRDAAKPDIIASNRAGELSRLKGPTSTCVWSVGHKTEASMVDVDNTKHEMSSNLFPRVCMLTKPKLWQGQMSLDK